MSELEKKKEELRALERGTEAYNKLVDEVFKLAIKEGEAVYGPTHYEFCRSKWCRCTE